MKQTTIDLLRHGEPEGGSMYRGGGTDHSLSEQGWQQMDASLASNRADWSAIVSSPMLRCKEYADQLSQKHQIPFEIHENLREAGYGSWEGKTPQQLLNADEASYWQFFADPVNSRPSNSEPLESFTQRIASVLDQVLDDYQGQHILLVSHLAVTRAIIGTVLSLPLASQQLIDMPFAGRLRLIKDRKGLRIVL
ncbi:MAG: histidine phosphatase family protein [Cocleimonas sp.]